MSHYLLWQTVFCAKSHNFNLQAIDYPVAAGDIHKTALSLVWLTHWPRGPRVNVWESLFPAEGYDRGWTSSWMLSKSFCWNDCRNKQSPYIHCDPADQTRLQQLLCIPTSVKSVQLIHFDFSTRRLFTTSCYVGVAATTCCYCDVGFIFKILWDQFNLLMGSGFWNLDYSSLIKYLGPEIHFLFDGISRFFFCPPAEIEILHSGMSVSQSVFWPTLNQMLYFIPTTMSDSLK